MGKDQPSPSSGESKITVPAGVVQNKADGASKD